MTKATYTHALNSRAYEIHFSIAKNALNAMIKIKDDHNVECVPFSEQELKLICFDYAFSAWENFLEHLGYMLFKDWDSGGKQRHYKEKFEKILDISDCFSSSSVQSDQVQQLNIQWRSVIGTIDPRDQNFIDLPNKRNPIKHVHSGKHETKTIVESSVRFPHANSTILDQLIGATHLGVTEADCVELLRKVESLINEAHRFLKANENLFEISLDSPETNDRASLWEIFIATPWAKTFTSQHIALER